MTKRKKQRLRTSHIVFRETISSADLAKQERKSKKADSLGQKEKGSEVGVLNLMIGSSLLEKRNEKKRKKERRKMT
jgi:hypothetical protein